MNAENFAEIIRNPAQLYQIPYQELKSLVLQYPYCRNLYHLLLQKSRMDFHRDFEQVLEKTATHSFDRPYLYYQLRALHGEEEDITLYESGIEYLELPDLSEFAPPRAELPLEPLDEVAGTEEPTDERSADDQLHQAPLPNSSELEAADDFAKLEEALRQRQSVSALPKEATPTAPPADETPAADMETVAAASTWLGILEKWSLIISPADMPAPDVSAAFPPGPETPADAAAPPASPPAQTPDPSGRRYQPKPKSSFSSWLRQYQPEHLQPQIDSLMESSRLAEKAAKRKKKKKKKNNVINFAEQSLRMNDEVASETLAELLVQQERYGQALQMYERLSLIFPEKSGYFAGKIEQLKKYL